MPTDRTAQPTLILLIEDVATTAAIVKRFLEASPGAVAGRGGRHLGRGAGGDSSRSFDLIIADLNLPDSTGIGTLDRLRQATERLIVVLTVEEGPAIRNAAIARGAYDFLQKDQLSQAALGQIVRLATIQANTFRALRESEARFRSLTELSSDWYWEQDAELRFVSTAGVTDARAASPRAPTSASAAGSCPAPRSSIRAGMSTGRSSRSASRSATCCSAASTTAAKSATWRWRARRYSIPRGFSAAIRAWRAT